jgi:hypothetical protein
LASTRILVLINETNLIPVECFLHFDFFDLFREALITCNFGLKPFVFDLNIIDNIIANETKNSEILPFKIAGE